MDKQPLTSKQLFNGFYRIERLLESDDLGPSQSKAETLYTALVANATRAGWASSAIKDIAFNAAWALHRRKHSLHEPSRNSVRNQMLVFTFGRLRRNP